MCLILIGIKAHPEYKFIMLANRDEFFNRNATGAHFNSDSPTLLAGIDLEAGGMWNGITKTGLLAAVTNYRQFPLRTDKISRGFLVKDFLTGKLTIDNAIQVLDQSANQYNGYNLLYGTVDNVKYYSNRANFLLSLTGGIYGLSNHLLDTPWPKVVLAKELFISGLDAEKINTDYLFEIMKNTRKFPLNELPNTGIGNDMEVKLSSIFIEMPEYGTRNTTLIMVNNKNEVYFEERTYQPTEGKVVERFIIE